MEYVKEIDKLLDAIDREIELLHQVTLRINSESDTEASQDMVRLLGGWEPFRDLHSSH